MSLDVAFWILAALCVGTALAVIFAKDIFHAALFLIVCFFGVAGIYVTLNADFLAAVQVLVYIGAVSVLLIFGIMLTRDPSKGSPAGKLRLPAIVVALALMGVMIGSMITFDWQTTADTSKMVSTEEIAGLLFDENGYVMTFEIAGLMLLAAIVGAIVLVRKE
ncbi:MAG: NADH-quinone oxidoreductase subunit L [Chloroflexi bacterium]|nr:NADH-quinone oxidoreductase subunit L [Chloroflexota bacterium]